MEKSSQKIKIKPHQNSLLLFAQYFVSYLLKEQGGRGTEEEKNEIKLENAGKRMRGVGGRERISSVGGKREEEERKSKRRLMKAKGLRKN